MDEKTKTIIEDILKDLSDEQVAQAAACESAEKLRALLDEAGVELPDELVNAVAGGTYKWETGFSEAAKKEMAEALELAKHQPIFF